MENSKKQNGFRNKFGMTNILPPRPFKGEGRGEEYYARRFATSCLNPTSASQHNRFRNKFGMTSALKQRFFAYAQNDERICHPEFISMSQSKRPTKKFRNEFETHQKAAFTLAEILITLGIIGIVAAMTIPTIAANVVGHKYRNQYKKTMSTISQAVRLNKANYDWDFADVSTPCDGADFRTHTSDSKMSVCAIFNSNLSTVTGYYREKDLYRLNYNFRGDTIGVSKGSYQYTVYVLADGSMIGFRSSAFNGSCSLPVGKKLNFDSMYGCTGFIDVNGVSLPNEEIKCSVGNTSKEIDADCIVKNKDVKDVYPIIFHDTTVEPATNAAKYVFLNTK